jgi:phosphomannomutase
MAQAFARGANRAGADAVLIGLCSTDGLYFASGHLGLPGVMFTASHNPAQYNGIKMCRAEAVPIGLDTGLAEIRDRVEAGDVPTPTRPGTHRAGPPRRLRGPPPELAPSPAVGLRSSSTRATAWRA